MPNKCWRDEKKDEGTDGGGREEEMEEGEREGWVDGWMGERMRNCLSVVLGDRRTDDRKYSLRSVSIAVPWYSENDPRTLTEL